MVSRFCSSQPAPGVELAGQDVAAPEGHVVLGFLQPGLVADDAHVADHQAAQRIGDVGHVQRVRASSGSNRLDTGGRP